MARMPGTLQNIWQGTDGAPVKSFNIDRERRKIDVASDILELQPHETPFLVLAGRVNKKPVKSLEVVWYDDDLDSWWTKATNSANSGVVAAATAEFDVEDPDSFKPKDIIKVARTGEIMIVNAIAGDTLSVTRGYSRDSSGTLTMGTAAADFYTTAHSTNDADNLMRMGNAMEENSNSPQPRATQPKKYFNYVQTFRTPFSGSNDNEAEAKVTTESERKRLQRRKAVEHRLDLERACLFGEKREIVADKRRLMGGLFQFLTDQYESCNIAHSTNGEANWESFLEDGFRYGSKEKVFITSHRMGSYLNQFAKKHINTFTAEETYGLRIREYISFHGTVYIVSSRMFEKDYVDKGVLLDLHNIELNPFAGQDSTLHTNIQENDLDGWKDEYMTKMTMKVRLEKAHRVLENGLG